MTIIQYVELARTRGDRSVGEYLFRRYDLHASLLQQQQLIDAEIDQYDPNELTTANPEQVAAYLEAKYLVQAPALLEDRITIEDRPTKIPSGERYDRGGPALVDGVEVHAHVPVDGDPLLLESSPRVRYMDGSSAPGRVVGRELVLSFRGTELPPHYLRMQLNRNLEQVRRPITAIASNLAEWNTETRQRIRDRIAARRERLGGLKQGLGFPLRPRSEPVEGYDRNAVVRRAIHPSVASGEPFIDMAHYDDILSVLSKMSVVMERAPSAFATMDEEAIRHQFIVPLNVLYEGQAHAEAFNFEGKTDILIRVSGRAVFIAECKFWKGEKALAAAVDQLLGYTSWRDTKTALLVFNRGRSFSTVLSKISGVIEAHSAFVRRVPYDVESGSRHILRRPDDEHRELTLTVLAFDVPGPNATEKQAAGASGRRAPGQE